jgi:hypothetical protein
LDAYQRSHREPAGTVERESLATKGSLARTDEFVRRSLSTAQRMIIA